MEWLNELFTGDPPQFHPDDHSGYMTKQKVGERRKDLAGVINEVDSDIWVITEGPNRVEELQLFFDDPLINGTWHCAVQSSGAQSLGIAVKQDNNLFDNTPLDWFDLNSSAEADQLKRATNDFPMDTDGDGLDEIHKYERKPIYAQVNGLGGKSFRIIGVHLKSKGIFEPLEWSKWWSKADGNRKKIVAQCHQLKSKFLNGYLSNIATKDIPLIVCGDINDGPGFDTSEMKILASGVERLMGSIWKPELCLGNVLYDTLSDNDKSELDFSNLYTASFKDPIFNNSYRRSWIDHILYSHRANNWILDGTVHHTMVSGNPIWKDYPKSSDHRPVSCVIDLDKI